MGGVSFPMPVPEPPVFGPPDLDVTVWGKPARQGSNSFGRHGGVHPDDAELYAWRESAAWALRAAWGARPQVDPDAAVVVRVTFRVPRTTSTRKSQIYPITSRDVDKHLRAALDAVAETSKNHPGAGVIANDSRVICAPPVKVYAKPGDAGSTRIELWVVPSGYEREGWVPFPELVWRHRSDLG